ncbi:LuxR C-terminal-related transcriptional regulator [Pseudomonas sp. GD03860]|uniref:LuxR C-terminal-related transcriptional regulator n=1 Tax=Pseudomonas TaxID=286 RepID=UPI00236383B4|nr:MULTISPECIES: LuxR C-terminal-related transcriptional regulator [Pseudomonas]MDD2058666.1 LuxR C-terminal-related transcriptional regulator [Pseudomonas putida]MDH0636899.1 LuxR C-terminal-related transcriptional regulator [Pseudomonas sp. GD03860]
MPVQRDEVAIPKTTSTKYASPKSAESHLPRLRLLDQMASATTTRLILVRAAAGFGKTTLLQQYRERCQAAGKQVLWVNLEPADNDLPRFLRVLSTGLACQLPACFDATAPDGVEALLEQVAACSVPFVVLLDEVEVIQNVEVLDFLQQWVEQLPAGCVLAMASRASPAIGLGRIRARGQLMEIKPGDLRFTPEESIAFIRDKRQIPLRDNELATLYRCTEGWIAGLYLASLSLKDRDDHADFIASFSGSNLELAEYLTEDILMRQSEDCRLFLMQTSILEQFCVPLCQAVTGRSDSGAMLEHLDRTNLFLVPVDSQQQWFRYHHLFASFLRHALDRLHPQMAKALHETAAQWFFDNDQPIPAIEHLFSAGLLEEAARRLNQHMGTLINSGRTRLLLRWFDRIAQQTLDGYPYLSKTYAWLLATTTRMKDAMLVAERLERVCGPDYAYVVQVLHCLQLGATDQAEACCTLGLELLAQMPADEVNLYMVVASSVAQNLVANGRYDEARSLLSEAMQRAPYITNSFLRHTFSVNESILDLIQGRLSNALVRMQSTVDAPLGVGQRKTHEAKLSLDIFYGLLMYEIASFDQAGKTLSRCLFFAKQVISPENQIITHVLTARIAYNKGDRNTWMRCLVELEQIGQQVGSHRLQCSAWLERARVAILEQRLDVASQALHAADQHGDWDRPDFIRFANEVDTPSIARQRLRIAQGDGAQAAQALRTAIEQARHWQHVRRELKLHILLAMALDSLQQPQEAFQALNDALRLASHEGFLGTFIEEGERLAGLMQRWAVAGRPRCRELGIEPNFVEELLQYLGAETGDGESLQNDNGAQKVLTAREYQILQLLAVGLKNRDIAEKVFLSEFTVKSHLQKIYAKLDTKGRTETLAIARAKGWIA